LLLDAVQQRAERVGGCEEPLAQSAFGKLRQ